MRTFILASTAGLMLSALTTAPAEPAAVKLAPHRAVYDLSLASSQGARAVESARGRIAFEFTGDACEGYGLKYRQVTVLESGETGARTSDLNTTTFEEGDGTEFRFRTETRTPGSNAETLVGEAERRGDGTLGVRLRQPKPDSFTLPGDPIFPTAHLKRLIEAARAGETTLTVKVFDGSDDGRKIYDTLAIIGRRIAPGGAEALEAPARQSALAASARWPMTLSYFAPGEGERTPIYVISFELYENGISRNLKLDYGDFALAGELKSLEVQPVSACSR